MNKGNVAQHKIFSGEAKFYQKKMNEKSIFSELFTEEIQEIVDSALKLTPKNGHKVQLSFPKKLQNVNMTIKIIHMNIT